MTVSGKRSPGEIEIILTNAEYQLAAELNHDLGHVYEPSDDASSALAAEVDYGWPVEQPEIAHTNGR